MLESAGRDYNSSDNFAQWHSSNEWNSLKVSILAVNEKK